MIADTTTQGIEAPAAPPYRFFELFRMVAIEGMQLINAADMVGLSLTEAAYVYDTAARWIATQPTPVDSMTKEQRLRGAERIAVEQMQHLYQEALAAWRRSQGEETVQQKTMHGGAVTTKRTSHGKAVYLALALRIADRMARLPLAVMPEWQDDGDDEPDDGDEHDEDSGPSNGPPSAEAPSIGKSATNPLVGDCSLTVDAKQEQVHSSPAPTVAKAEQSTGYGDSENTADTLWPLLNDCAGTVHLPEASARPCLRLHAPEPLNRHERRRQQRLEARRAK